MADQPTVPDPRETVAALRRLGINADASARRRAEYSSDASLYRVIPAAVVFPRHVDEIVAIGEVGRSLGVPLTARGAGTSIAGNAVGSGIVVDFSRHLNQIRDLDPESGTVVVQPGVVLDDLQRAAAPYRFRFGPDPSTHSRCTIGGMIGNNACGSRTLGYGRTADNVIELDVVTGTGEPLRVTGSAAPQSSPTLARLQSLVGSRLGLIRTEFGRFSRQVSGYSLEHLLPEQGFDVAKAFVGSEGTWGLLREATLRLVPEPAATALLVLGYPDMAAAADAVPALLPFGPTALEGLDRRIVEVVAGRTHGPGVPALPDGGGWLFAEFSGDHGAEVAARAEEARRAAGATEGWVVSPDVAAMLWRIREDGAGLAPRATDPAGQSGWEDAAVPPHHLGSYLREFNALMDEFHLTGVPYGHFGDGCVHIRIDFTLNHPDGRSVFREFLTEAARLVARYGGSMSGEHGDGRARSELLPLMYSPAAIETLAAVKGIFDPDDLLNPGVIVRPRQLDADLRAASVPPMRTGLGFRYHRDHGDFSVAVHRCTGVGKCRATGGTGVMCPSFRATRDEKDSTRGRARVLQELANGTLVQGWQAPEVLESLDLCLSCKACSSECPTGVDMAAFKAEALYQRYRHRPRPASHYALGWLPRWARAASLVPTTVNRLAAGRLGALGKRLAGVESRRDLPAFAVQTFRDWFKRHSIVPGAPVLLWVDTFTEHFTPDVGIAAVEVLQRAGYSVRIPSRPLCCGLTWISTGQLDTARKVLQRTIDTLEQTAATGVPIVGLEPSCTAVLRGDAAELLKPTDRAAVVARSVRTLAELLTRTAGWQPPDLSAATAVVQPHCHHRAVLGFGTDLALLDRTGITSHVVAGCCGMAGNFGAERGHFDLSVAIAEAALLPAARQHPDAVVLADGFSCRVQLEQLAGRRARHLAELLNSSPG
ncbi:FAD-binding and (Fe-S)-binding domain-containing protein [Mycobacterium sp.]|uniref:FAD-binding and (Fe-S)-binding domain-containing protein n=1 Tax=Mycobacterium sp. TaxID=1785 RepID=UPI001272CAA6|nr:FAD-binding and (Fe-S)-binding domain-containing protein [Mycobacterium sp.]KAA8967045.1 MAG: FAD-binding protein [Mycobacterium sp.]